MFEAFALSVANRARTRAAQVCQPIKETVRKLSASAQQTIRKLSASGQAKIEQTFGRKNARDESSLQNSMLMIY